MKKIIIGFVGLIIIISCTDNVRSKTYGGGQVIELKDNERFINATWKETSLWIIVEDTLKNEFYMREKSSLGLIEGKITFKKNK